MGNWSPPKKIAIIAVLFAAYFPAALYLKHTYIPQPPPQKDRIWLTGPFLPLVAGGKAYIAWLPKLEHLADSLVHFRRSSLIAFENDLPLGPPHSQHQEIVDFGGGRYSHWAGLGLVFSTTDGSNPNQNWKLYSVIKLEPQTIRHHGGAGGPAMPQMTE